MKQKTELPETPKPPPEVRAQTMIIPPEAKPKQVDLERELEELFNKAKANIRERERAVKEDREAELPYTIDDAILVYFEDYRPRGRSAAASRTSSRGSTTATSTSKHYAAAKPPGYNVYLDPMRTVPPWHRKEYVLSKREASMYRHLSTTYGNEKLRKNREVDFFKRLESLQLEEWRKNHKDYRDELHRKVEKKHQQQKQLRHVRNKFNKEQVQRFASQYVTNRILQHEWTTR